MHELFLKYTLAWKMLTVQENRNAVNLLVFRVKVNVIRLLFESRWDAIKFFSKAVLVFYCFGVRKYGA